MFIIDTWKFSTTISVRAYRVRIGVEQDLNNDFKELDASGRTVFHVHNWHLKILSDDFGEGKDFNELDASEKFCKNEDLIAAECSGP